MGFRQHTMPEGRKIVSLPVLMRSVLQAMIHPSGLLKSGTCDNGEVRSRPTAYPSYLTYEDFVLRLGSI